MKDHRTVAFSINWPTGTPLLTIWHHDPCRSGPSLGLAPTDSCGWFTPPSCQKDRYWVRRAGEDEYRSIFARRLALQQGQEFVRFCYEPTCHDAVFYAWRTIRHVRSGGWSEPNEAERAVIFSLANDPLDNLRIAFAAVNSPEQCAEFFLMVFRAQLRFDRPRWKHPRWHVWHWRLQFHPWESLCRRLFDRCEQCGKGFKRRDNVFSIGRSHVRAAWFRSRIGIFHDDCLLVREQLNQHLREVEQSKSHRKA